MRSLIGILFLLVLSACDSSKFQETPLSQFEGKWRLCGRSIYEGMTIDIKTNKDGNLVGTIDSLNENKFVQFFMSKGDKFVSAIERKSNFEFVVKEKKIGSELMSLYDVSTTSEYKNVRFHSPDTIYLNNSVYYLRIK